MKTKMMTAAVLGLGMAPVAALANAPEAARANAPAAPAPAFGGPVALGDGLVLDPMVDARLRWEDVSQPAKGLSADAVTLRLRVGAELTHTPSHIAILAEAEGNLALGAAYNAFPYAQPASSQYRPAHAVIADPQSAVLNRLQARYQNAFVAVTVGRQRINLDDQRWVGAAPWRQNEQTFDAVRATLALGPVALDATYADSQRTTYGSEGGPRVAYDGHFGFLGAAVKTRYVAVKGFAYLLDYQPNGFANLAAAHSQLDSSQTYGLRAAAGLPLGKAARLALAGSYARQSSYKDNPNHYAADYVAVEGSLAAWGLTARAGYEDMGADANASHGPWSVQTPMATLHAFDGWADVFLTTPARGLKDTYGGLAYAFPRRLGVPGLNASLTYHQFDSDIAHVDYGHEWDAALGFKAAGLNWLVKYANYQAVGAASLGAATTTKKLWLQTELAF